MIIFETIESLRAWIKEQRKADLTVGFVPTMGFLHQGHGSLMSRARQENDRVICSVFVNPTQFGPNEDYDAYPRSREKDIAYMESQGVDAVFFPSVEEMYPEGFETFVNLEGTLTSGLCGASRPGHFKGVATVVTKLFNMVQPDRAYFGQKDAQQVSVIRRMVRDLNMPVEIIPCPIVRESDGLALSSRNTYLDSEQRQNALVLYRSLQAAKEAIAQGEQSAEVIRKMISNRIESTPGAETDYIEIVDNGTLQAEEILCGEILIALAVRFGKTRLIDNMTLEVPCAG